MKYTQEYRIYENDVDFRKMATLGTLLRYCQQIGAEDAEHYGITPGIVMPAPIRLTCWPSWLCTLPVPRAWKKPLPCRPSRKPCTAPSTAAFTTFCDAQGREEMCVDSRWVLIDTDKRMILRKHPGRFPHNGLGG